MIQCKALNQTAFHRINSAHDPRSCMNPFGGDHNNAASKEGCDAASKEGDHLSGWMGQPLSAGRGGAWRGGSQRGTCSKLNNGKAFCVSPSPIVIPQNEAGSSRKRNHDHVDVAPSVTQHDLHHDNRGTNHEALCRIDKGQKNGTHGNAGERERDADRSLCVKSDCGGGHTATQGGGAQQDLRSPPSLEQACSSCPLSISIGGSCFALILVDG